MKRQHLLPLTRKIVLAVRFEYYPTQVFAAERWLAFGDPSLLRLGIANEFECARLNRNVVTTTF
ncbi:MAG: hypothetical protein J6J22_08155 [Alistipes sp.]|nr:hypothetical protein [Alistipes sp.]